MGHGIVGYALTAKRSLIVVMEMESATTRQRRRDQSQAGRIGVVASHFPMSITCVAVTLTGLVLRDLHSS